MTHVARATRNLELNPASHLFQRGLVWAWLSRGRGGNRCYESVRGDRGEFSGSIDSGDWINQFGRHWLWFDAGAAKVTFGTNPILGTGPWSVAGWFNAQAGGWDGPIVNWGDSGTDDNYVELNIDGASFFHSNQATIGNTATFVGAYTNGLWNSFLYAHADNSNLNGDRLWINGKEASGGGTGTDVLDIQPGSDTLAIGEANKSSVFNINGAVGDLMIFDQELGEPEARIVDNPADINYADLILDDTNIASVYDFGGIR